jgi:hypothetical protein
MTTIISKNINDLRKFNNQSKIIIVDELNLSPNEISNTNISPINKTSEKSGGSKMIEKAISKQSLNSKITDKSNIEKGCN